jgi:hypothetical protein
LRADFALTNMALVLLANAAWSRRLIAMLLKRGNV